MTGYRAQIVAPELLRNYPHAAAYAEIAAAIDEGLQDIGQYSAEGRPIVVGGHLIPEDVPREAIIYNLEPECVLSEAAIKMLRAHPVWDWSPRNAQKLRGHHIPVSFVMHPGYAKCLTKVPHSQEKDIDLLFYGSLNPRRNRILDGIEARGFKVTALFGEYGPNTNRASERDAMMGRAKLILNLHFYEDARMLETIRIHYILANDIAVLSELSADPDANHFWGEAVEMAPYKELVDRAEELLTDPIRLARLRHRGGEWIRKYPQSAYLVSALETVQ